MAIVRQLHVPAACKVGVIITDEGDEPFRQMSWSHLLPVLHSWFLTCRGVTAEDMQRLQFCRALSCVSLFVQGTFGREGQPIVLSGQLAGQFARLDCLFIHAFEVHVVVPAHAEWKASRVVAGGGGIHLTFKDMQRFAGTTASFLLSGDGLESSGVRPALREALISAGKSWAEFDIQGPGMYPKGGGLVLSGCLCGACRDCLLRRGVLSQ
jgi:hypothetical protein